MSDNFSKYKVYALLSSDAYNDKYKIVANKFDVLHRYSFAGFQATLYKDIKTGEKIIAYRGTNDINDFGEDALLALFGSNR